MDHQTAIATQAVERYLLNELTREERLAFEDHYFDCAECADGVRSGTLLLANGREAVKETPQPGPSRTGRIAELPVRPAPQSWRNRIAIPATIAAAVLICVTGYQSLVTVPALRSEVAMADSTYGPLVQTLRAQSRAGDVPVVRVDPAKRVDLAFELNTEHFLPFYDVDLQTDSGARIAALAHVPPQDGKIQISLPPSKLPPGRYELFIRSPGSKAEPEVSRFEFQVQKKG